MGFLMQFAEQVFRFPQGNGIEALGEPVVDVSKQGARLAPSILANH